MLNRPKMSRYALMTHVVFVMIPVKIVPFAGTIPVMIWKIAIHVPLIVDNAVFVEMELVKPVPKVVKPVLKIAEFAVSVETESATTEKIVRTVLKIVISAPQGVVTDIVPQMKLVMTVKKIAVPVHPPVEMGFAMRKRLAAPAPKSVAAVLPTVATLFVFPKRGNIAETALRIVENAVVATVVLYLSQPVVVSVAV